MINEVDDFRICDHIIGNKAVPLFGFPFDGRDALREQAADVFAEGVVGMERDIG